MRLLIRYDAGGDIISVARVAHITEELDHPFGETGAGGGVLEVEDTGGLAELECHDIHDRYRVDVKKQQLKKKPARKSG